MGKDAESTTETVDPGMRVNVVADDAHLSGSDDRRGPHGRILRVALAMRGGVSLAVWIGGAVAELDVLRRIRIVGTLEKPGAELIAPSAPVGDADAAADPSLVGRAEVYARALDRAGFDRIEFDVLAGASAGGLNAVLYSVAQRTGSSVDALRDVWLEAGGAWNLLRRPRWRAEDSVLRGDEYFWSEVEKAIERMYAKETPRNPAHHAKRVTVELSATVLDGADSTERGTQEGRGHFRLVGSSRPEDRHGLLGRDIPAVAETEPETEAEAEAAAVELAGKLARLALAARSTSSFPGAFEPALIDSVVKTELDGPVDDVNEGRVDMSYAFNARRAVAPGSLRRPFRIVDGGVLDNVPIDRAVRSIRRLPSEVSAMRALIYLDPDPPQAARNALTALAYGDGDARIPSLREWRYPDPASTFLNAVLEGRARRGIRESAGDEIADIERIRLALMLDDGRRESHAAVADTSVPYVLVEARKAYIRYRAVADSVALAPALAEPSVWQLGTDLVTRDLIDGWSQAERDRLLRACLDRYQENGTPAAILQATESSIALPEAAPVHLADVVFWGPQALVEASQCVLGWIRSFEECLADAATIDLRNQLSELRMTAYRILNSATRRRDERLAAALRAAPGGDRRVEDFLNAFAGPIKGWALLRRYWSGLDSALTCLRGQSVPAGTNLERVEARWGQTPWSHVPSFTDGFRVWDLAPFAAASGIPEPVSRIRFAAITGAEPAASPEDLATLRRRKLDRTARSLLALRNKDLTHAKVGPVVDEILGGSALRADEKLAGTSFANFSGFLAAEWRENDWLWGRLDAGAGILRSLDEFREFAPSSIRTRVDDPPWRRDTAIQEVQDLLLAEAGARPRKLDTATADNPSARAKRMRASLSMGLDDLSSLPAPYRLALLSRVARVAGRAVRGSRSWAFFFLEPLFAPVALALNPIRQGLLAAVVGLTVVVVAGLVPADPLAGSAAADAAAAEAGRQIWFMSAATAIVVLLLAYWTVRQRQRVRRVRSAVRKSASRVIFRAQVADDSKTAAAAKFVTCTQSRLTRLGRLGTWQWFAYVVMLLATLLCVWLIWWETKNVDEVSIWILIGASIVLGWRGQARLNSPRTGRGTVRLFVVGAILYGVWTAAIVAVALSPTITGAFEGLVAIGPDPDTAQVIDWTVLETNPALFWAIVTVAIGSFFAAMVFTIRWLPVIGRFRDTAGSAHGLRRRITLRTATINWFTVSVVAGAAAAVPVWIKAVFIDTNLTPLPGLDLALMTVLSVYFWLSAVWWLPEIPTRLGGAGDPYRGERSWWTPSVPAKEWQKVD